MVFDFNTIAEETLPRFKGGDLSYAARRAGDDSIKVMDGRLVAGASIGLHTHTDSSEVIIVTAGEGIATIDGVEERLTPGMAHYCPKGSAHTLRNPGPSDLRFYAIVPTL